MAESRARATKGASNRLEEAADELYALEPDRFRRRRDELAASARAAGDRETAGAIGSLRRPTVTAWAVNRCVRDHRDEVEALLKLGRELRRAQSGLDVGKMRSLSAKRREVIDSLVDQALRAARDSQHPLGETTARALEETFSAALADDAAGAELRSGRLTRALSYSGFGTAPPAGGQRAQPGDTRPAPPLRQTSEESDPSKRSRPARQKVDRELADARRTASEADGELKQQQGRVRHARTEVERLQEQMASLQNLVGDKRAEVSSAQRTLREEQRRERELGRAAAAARERVDRATAARSKKG